MKQIFAVILLAIFLSCTNNREGSANNPIHVDTSAEDYIRIKTAKFCHYMDSCNARIKFMIDSAIKNWDAKPPTTHINHVETINIGDH